MCRLLPVLLLTALVCAEDSPPNYLTRKREQFRVIFEWKTINYTWPDAAALSAAIEKQTYIPKNVLISGIKHFNGTLYVSMPRTKPGVPATLATIPAEPVDKNTAPLVNPFPNWDLNTVGDCKAFQSVQSFEIDLEGKLWVLDNGRAAPLNSSVPVPSCLPSLTIVDLKDLNSMVRYNFPNDVANARSYLNDIVIDDSDGGYAYITDNSVLDPGIIVFSKKDNKSWKFKDPISMKGSKDAILFNVNGVRLNMSINIDGIALGPRYVNKNNAVDRNVYFSPLSSFNLFGVPSAILKNENFSAQPEVSRSKMVANVGNKTSQTDGMIMDEEGYLFYGLLGDHSIAHWNHKTNFGSNQEIISKDRNYIQWVDRFAFDDTGNLYVVINRMHNFISNKVNESEVNYRILRSHVGTKSYLYSPMLIAQPLPTKKTTVKFRTNSSPGLVGSLGAVALSYCLVAVSARRLF